MAKSLFPNGFTPEHIKEFEVIASNRALSVTKIGTFNKFGRLNPQYASRQTQIAYDFYMRGKDKASTEVVESQKIEIERLTDAAKEALYFIEKQTPGIVLDIKDTLRILTRSKE